MTKIRKKFFLMGIALLGISSIAYVYKNSISIITEKTYATNEQLSKKEIQTTDTQAHNVTNIGRTEITLPNTYTLEHTTSNILGNFGLLSRQFNVSKKTELTQEDEQINQLITQSLEATKVSVSSIPSYSALCIYLADLVIPYQNGGKNEGQSIIDSDPSGTASTWGGEAVQSGTDGMNTHFIGHNPGIFEAIFSLEIGSPIIVTDASGTPTTYYTSSIFQVDDYGLGTSDGLNYWDSITGTGGGERITLQSCINDSVNLIVVATKER